MKTTLAVFLIGAAALAVPQAHAAPTHAQAQLSQTTAPSLVQNVGFKKFGHRRFHRRAFRKGRGFHRYGHRGHHFGYQARKHHGLHKGHRVKRHGYRRGYGHGKRLYNLPYGYFYK